MKNIRRFAVLAAAVAILCLACYFFGKSTGNGGDTEMSAVVLENKLTEISEFASLTYSYTNMAEFENSKDFYGVKLPFTTKSFIITYDGEIKAGVDLSRAEVSISGSKITVKLPEAEILSHQIDEDSLEVFDETTSIFNPLKVTDYNTFSKEQKEKMEQKAEENGLLAEASTKAQSSIKSFIEQIAGESYTVNVSVSE